MYAKDDALDLFHAWVLTRGYSGSTANTYKSGLRLILNHLGQEVSQESVDTTFQILRPSTRYAAARRAWLLFEEYARGRGIDIPTGPSDGRSNPRVIRKAPTSPIAVLPPEVLSIAKALRAKIGLSCEQIAEIYWENESLQPDGKSRFPHPRKRTQSVDIEPESMAVLREWAAPTEKTPLIPFKPGSTIPYPLELILSGR